MRTHSTIVLVLFAVIAFCVVSLIPQSITAENNGECVAYDGSTYRYTTATFPEYHSAIIDFDGSVDTIRVQSRMEGYSVTEIGNEAFASCLAHEIMIPEDVSSLGSKVFSGCLNLSTIYFMGKMPKMESDTFDDIPSSVEIKILEKNRSSWSSFDTLKQEIMPIMMYSSDGSSFTYFVFDDSITIHSYISGTDVVIPSSIVVDGKEYPVCHVGPSSFLSSNVESVDLPENITTIHIAAFKYCNQLKTISLPDALTSICDEAFRMPIDNIDWNDSMLNNVVLPEKLNYIGFEAFRMCYSLESMVIPDSVTHFGDGAFRVCVSMRSITLNDKITELKEFSFDNCFSLETVVLSNNLIKIGENAFFADRSLRTIVIPQSVKYINNNAFNGCISLSSVIVSDNVSIGTNAFKNCPIQKLTLVAEDNEYYGGIIEKYLSSDSWIIPGLINNISEVVIDTEAPINVDIIGVSDSFISFTNRTTNTTGGHYFDDTYAELFFKGRAGQSFRYDDHWILAEIYDVFVSSTEPDGGIVMGAGSYLRGTTVTVTASPFEYYHFTGWSNGSKDLSITITLASDVILVAFFEPSETFVIMATALPEGKGIVIGTGTYVSGDKIVLTASPVDGYKFIKWDDGSTEEERSMVAKSDMTVIAYFGNATLSFDQSGGTSNICESIVNIGDHFSIPGYNGIKPFYNFSGWYCNGKLYSDGDLMEVTGDATLIAIWSLSYEQLFAVATVAAIASILIICKRLH